MIEGYTFQRVYEYFDVYVWECAHVDCCFFFSVYTKVCFFSFFLVVLVFWVKMGNGVLSFFV